MADCISLIQSVRVHNQDIYKLKVMEITKTIDFLTIIYSASGG